ncbi:hypothetical protein T281_11890 [Rhodomicrobium udaipurense JA643]|uniref:Uncharacterized protein n=1 Tax=Rhodomicrobium udaipurense TaxID=1202716 RepID=A0A8I1KKN2_9HYPH|nr:hypothetical protein [Rhodomicrobium udaipurense]KAI94277.1 hypothetical protein T281_11890 [Rhodomicrobium udaipurense JA643]MBJ7544376.1 hypothetical protein [Rhodomicrobium udaipurense]
MKILSGLAVGALGLGSLVLAATFILPWAGGYGYAATFFYAYDYACPGKSAPLTQDNYRVFLLNRGCSLDDAAQDLAREYRKTPERVMALYRGEAQPQSADEVMITDAIRAELKQSFKPFALAANCKPGEICNEGLSPFWGDDVVSRLFAKAGDLYLGYAVPMFYDGLGMGAHHIAAVLASGPLAKGVLFVVYAIGAAFLLNFVWGLLRKAIS